MSRDKTSSYVARGSISRMTEGLSQASLSHTSPVRMLFCESQCCIALLFVETTSGDLERAQKFINFKVSGGKMLGKHGAELNFRHKKLTTLVHY